MSTLIYPQKKKGNQLEVVALNLSRSEVRLPDHLYMISIHGDRFEIQSFIEIYSGVSAFNTEFDGDFSADGLVDQAFQNIRAYPSAAIIRHYRQIYNTEEFVRTKNNQSAYIDTVQLDNSVNGTNCKSKFK